MNATDHSRSRGLISDALAAEMIAEHERDRLHAQMIPVREPACECCGTRQATRYGVAVVNARAFPNANLCGECFIPFEEVGLPADVDREYFAEVHSDGYIPPVELPPAE